MGTSEDNWFFRVWPLRKMLAIWDLQFAELHKWRKYCGEISQSCQYSDKNQTEPSKNSARIVLDYLDMIDHSRASYICFYDDTIADENASDSNEHVAATGGLNEEGQVKCVFV